MTVEDLDDATLGAELRIQADALDLTFDVTGRLSDSAATVVLPYGRVHEIFAQAGRPRANVLQVTDLD